VKKTVRKFKETVEIRSSLLVRVRSHRYFPIGAVAGVFLLAACVHIWQRVHVIHLAQEIAVLRMENRLLGDDTRKVHADLSALSMSSRVETYAADSLGLAQVAATELITLVPEGVQAPSVKDDLHMVVKMAERWANVLPSVTQAQANAGELISPVIDSLANGGDD